MSETTGAGAVRAPLTCFCADAGWNEGDRHVRGSGPLCGPSRLEEERPREQPAVVTVAEYVRAVPAEPPPLTVRGLVDTVSSALRGLEAVMMRAIVASNTAPGGIDLPLDGELRTALGATEEVMTARLATLRTAMRGARIIRSPLALELRWGEVSGWNGWFLVPVGARDLTVAEPVVGPGWQATDHEVRLALLRPENQGRHLTPEAAMGVSVIAVPEPQPVRVVAGVVFDGVQVLVGLRRRDAKIGAGRWELPGGKVEAGETDAQALARELLEECALRLRTWTDRPVRAKSLSGPGMERPVVVAFYPARVDGVATALWHDELRWMTVADVEATNTDDWMPADRDVALGLLRARCCERDWNADGNCDQQHRGV